MEWVETTGKTVEEALDVALDQLGVDEAEAEYEVLGEAKTGLFGRVKSEARVRARVRPTAPPSKDAANNNRRRRSTGARSDRPAKTSSGSSGSGGRKSSTTTEDDSAVSADAKDEQTDKPRKPRQKPSRKPAAPRAQGASDMAEEEIPLVRQGEVASGFLSGLLSEIQASADISVDVDDEDEIVSITVDGDNLGHLIGPKGATLQSLQELTRTVVQRQTGARNGRVIVDVGRYREKRREALERFSRQVADEILSSGGTRILEPMNPADRKVVHDLINSIDGVSTSSEGEEPRRYVVIRSDAAESNEVG